MDVRQTHQWPDRYVVERGTPDASSDALVYICTSMVGLQYAYCFYCKDRNCEHITLVLRQREA
jgi:hypothetical protein